MSSIVLLTAMFLGQCGPRGCPSPSFAPSFSQGFAPVVLQQPAYQPAPVVEYAGPSYAVKTYRVKHAGTEFNVRGYYRPDTGKVAWDVNDPENVRSFEAATAPKPAVAVKPTPPTVRPVSPPEIGQAVPDVQNFGLSPERMRHKPWVTAASPEARRFVEEANDPAAPAGKLHVTVIGSDEDRAKVIADLNSDKEFDDIRQTMMIQGYKPGEWPVDPSLGFKNDGKPTIIVQTPKGHPADPRGGRVVFRSNSYSMGPKALAEAIRKADPTYKPSADPTPDTLGGSACPLGFNRSHTPYLVGAAVVVFFLLKLPRKEG